MLFRSREFLFRLASPYGGGIKRVRREVRDEARRLLRHYPTAVDLAYADRTIDKAEALNLMGREKEA